MIMEGCSMEFHRLRWLRALLRASLRLDLTFRASWFLDLFGRLVQFAVTVLFFELLYAGRPAIGGVPWEDMLVLLGTYQCMRTLSDTVFSATNRICAKVEEGTLDYDLLKPVGARLLASVGRIRTTRLIEMIAGLFLVLRGMNSVPGRQAGPGNWAAFGLLVLLGAWIKYCLVFILNCSSFWIIETYGLYSLFDQVFDLARYPITVFRGFWRILFSYVMPVTLVANLPVMALIESPGTGLILPAVLHALAWYLAGNGLWKVALRRYSGASA